MIGRLDRQSFRAMGTSCLVAVTARPGQRDASARVLRAARAEIAACERVLSRFERTSDLSLVNASAGQWVAVDERLVGATLAALRARELTGGRFDPTILPSLVAAGYDRTFDELVPRPARERAGRGAAAEVEVDRDSGCIRIERGAGLDLGGIGKGYAATRALHAARFAAPGIGGVLVDLGGDIALSGLAPGGGPWRVAIADPRERGALLGTLGLFGGGVATSGRDRRRFGPGGSLHHLIDPTTGSPAAAGPIAVTVVAPDAADAEAHATALAISSLDWARSQLAAFHDLAALYVTAEGEPAVIGALPLLGDQHLPGAAAA